MNRHQKIVTKLAKLNMKIYNINFLKAKRQANKELFGIKEMLINRYNFKIKWYLIKINDLKEYFVYITK